MKAKLYHYKAFVTKVYDGDTITVDLDLGMRVHLLKKRVRLYGIDTPELRGVSAEIKAKGIAARDWLRDKILNKEIVLRTLKDKKGKYGRLLGILYIDGVNLNDLLVEEGHAVVYLP